MLTLYHGANTRSSRIVRLLIEMDMLDRVDIRPVGLIRQGNIGASDPANPHPEGKVPLLVHDGTAIRESNAIMLYLTDLFDSPLGAPIGSRERGTYLSWLAYYGNVVEPVMVAQMAGVTHPAFQATFRGAEAIAARLSDALADRPYLLGDSFTAADLLMVSPFTFMPDFTPDVAEIRDWIARCQSRPSQQATQDFDAQLSAAAA